MTFLTLTGESNSADVARFHAWQKENAHMMIWYHAEWCGHCVDMRNDWKQFATRASKDFTNLHLVAVQDTALGLLGLQDQVEMGFPTIRIYHKGKYLKEFEGARTSDNLHAFANQYCKKATPKSTRGGQRSRRRRSRARGGRTTAMAASRRRRRRSRRGA